MILAIEVGVYTWRGEAVSDAVKLVYIDCCMYGCVRVARRASVRLGAREA